MRLSPKGPNLGQVGLGPQSNFFFFGIFEILHVTIFCNTETGSKIAKKVQNPDLKTKVKWAVFRKTVNTTYSSL